MSTSIKTGTPNMTIDEACDVMAEWQVRRLPIIENDSLVGIVSIGDIAVDCNYDMEVSDCLSEICEHDHDWDWK
jgi:predicted transcriptional regulator